jgi:hypothetical protein
MPLPNGFWRQNHPQVGATVIGRFTIGRKQLHLRFDGNSMLRSLVSPFQPKKEKRKKKISPMEHYSFSIKFLLI